MISISISRIIKIKVQHPPSNIFPYPQNVLFICRVGQKRVINTIKMIIIVSLITHNDHKYVINLSSIDLNIF